MKHRKLEREMEIMNEELIAESSKKQEERKEEIFRIHFQIINQLRELDLFHNYSSINFT